MAASAQQGAVDARDMAEGEKTQTRTQMRMLLDVTKRRKTLSWMRNVFKDMTS